LYFLIINLRIKVLAKAVIQDNSRLETGQVQYILLHFILKHTAGRNGRSLLLNSVSQSKEKSSHQNENSHQLLTLRSFFFFLKT